MNLCVHRKQPAKVRGRYMCCGSSVYEMMQPLMALRAWGRRLFCFWSEE
jgi:hypothetical protein